MAQEHLDQIAKIRDRLGKVERNLKLLHRDLAKAAQMYAEMSGMDVTPYSGGLEKPEDN